MQMVCDSDGRISNVSAKYGGNSHESFVWENSYINIKQSLHQQNGEMVWLLSDSGYPQRLWLLTPYVEPVDRSQAAYNEKHMRARVIIENSFGRLKNKWRCYKDRVLHYRPLKYARIILACCVLYNFGINCGVVEEHDDYQMNEDAGDTLCNEVGISTSTDLFRGRIIRDQLARRL